MSTVELFPIFLKLAGRSVLVVGGGVVAASKIEALRAAGADITVVAPAVSDAIRSAGLRILERAFEADDLTGQWLVVAAATPEVNRRVAREAERRCLFVNAVDDPANASAYLGGVLRRDGVAIAISTSGRAPALAGLLREGLDAMLPEDLDEWFRRADELKREWRSKGVPMEARRPQLMEALVKLYEDRKEARANRYGRAFVSTRDVRPICPGFASLVGAGPGDPELLTWRAILRLRSADLVLYDGLVPKQLAQLAAGAKLVSVAKRAGRKALAQDTISDRLIDAAWRGQRVVRLKAGDPYVLGRGGEEAARLARAGVPFEVVPGVSSAIAAPGLAGIPVTHRGMSSGFVVVSGHAESAYASVLGALPPVGVTVVVLMGTGERSGIRRTLQGAGWPADTPAALVVNASQPDQRVWIGTLAALDSPAADVPAGDAGVIVIGRVVSLATAPHFSLPFVSEETSWQPSTIQRR